MNIKDFFVGLGHAVAHSFGLIRKLVPEQYLIAGIEYAASAALNFTDNSQRKSWVAEQLKGRFHVSSSVANLIVELVVQHLKDAERAAADKAETAITAHPI